ncbi:MAG: AarF/UbiB family protein [Desulfobacterales bacterium]
MINPISFEQARAYLKSMPGFAGRSQIIARLRAAAGMQGPGFQEKAAEELLKETRPEEAVPEIYREYRPIVKDGIRFLFSRLSLERIFAITADQLLMKQEVPVTERLIALAKQIPTLHKLGQIIARNRNTDPEFRKWLIQLENGMHGTDIAVITEGIRNEIWNYLVPCNVRIDERILSEASVGTVVGFTWTAPDTGKTSRGVFKVLRPGIREYLTEEFRLLDQLARFFHRNRKNYPLRDFRFVETFADIRDALREEINLSGEQTHLRQAQCFYQKNEAVRIPALLPFSTQNMTVMEFMEGDKITDIPMTAEERKQCAEKLFETVIWQPLFSRGENPLFHGDPHAGNIFGTRDAKGHIQPVLLDWSLTGTLSREHRMNMVRLHLAILLGNEDLICEILELLSEENAGNEAALRIKSIVRALLKDSAYAQCGFMEKAFWFIDQTAIRGIVFPKDLLLFRKSFFTLDGVLHAIDPDFRMDACIFRLLEKMFIEELPGRCIGSILPRLDRRENYRSLVSNRDLQLLLFEYVMEHMRKGAGVLSAFMGEFFLREWQCFCRE